MRLVVRLFIAWLALAMASGARFPGEADRVLSLPGAVLPTGFGIYSGYLPVNATSGKYLFYMLVEAPNSTSTPLPLVRFLNGGPGCSSIGGGCMEETGPLRPDENGQLVANPQSWNQFANMLYIESPVGVGFSFSKTPSDYTSSDDSTASDNYQAMLRFLDKFPQFVNRDFYLAGESYAGHYIPTLVSKILDKPLPLNFKGFAVGNPTTSITDDFFYGTYKTWMMRGLISTPTWKAIKGSCSNVTYLNPPSNCQNALNTAASEMGSKFNPYDLDVPMCPAEEQRRVAALMLGKVGGFAAPPLPYDPCEDTSIATYLNRADVQAALHVIPNATGTVWADCTVDPRWNYQYSDFYNVQVPVYERVMALPLRVVVYSGTADTVVPYLGTQRWIWNMMNGTTPTTAWQSWSVPSDTTQTAGYTVGWGNFRFVTIRGAGHLVPQTSPVQGLSVLRFLLFNQP